RAKRSSVGVHRTKSCKRRSRNRRKCRGRPARRKHWQESFQSSPTGYFSCGDCCAGCASGARRPGGFAPKRLEWRLHQPRKFLELRPLGAVLAHNGQENLFESRLAACFPGDTCTKFFEGTLGDKPAFVNDGHMAAEPLDNFENVRGKEDGDAALGHAAQER